MKTYEQFLNELNLNPFKFFKKKSKFKVGDICTMIGDYESYGRKLKGKKCMITKVVDKGEMTDLRNYRYRLNDTKNFKYDIEFIDAYDEFFNISTNTEGRFQPRTAKIKSKIIKLFVKEEELEFDPVATRKHKEEQDEFRKRIEADDPYGEEDWIEKEKEKERPAYTEEEIREIERGIELAKNTPIKKINKNRGLENPFTGEEMDLDYTYRNKSTFGSF